MTDIATAQRPTDRAAANRKRPHLESSLAAVRQPVQQDGRLLYGSFDDLGVCIRWHDFQPSRPFEWSRLFHPESLELCLNVSGRGFLRCAAWSAEFGPLTAGFYLSGKGELRAWRKPDQQHRFIIIQFSSRFLCRHLAHCDGALHPLVDGFLQGTSKLAGLGEIRRLTVEQEHLVAQLQQPHTAQAARPLWYQSKTLQLMVDFFFERPGQDELFCDRQKRVARERVGSVVALLRSNLAEPPGLAELGRCVGCSPFYLSRTFSAEMNMTIPQFLRKLRMERAAELLRSGRFNVTEAALEVGYSSLSHFSQAFCQTMGCCPALYPLKIKATQK